MSTIHNETPLSHVDGGDPLPLAIHTPATPQTPSRPNRGPVAYIMSRFPKITETFVLYEILAVEQAGQEVEVYSLLRERAAVMHPEAEPVVERAHFAPFLSWSILRSNCRYLWRKPTAYLGALGALMRGTWGSTNFLLGGLAVFPKVVAFADSMENQGITHIHAHFCNHPAAAAFIIHRLTGIPYSFTAHGSDLHRDRHMLRDKVREARFVVTISEYNREQIIAECGPAASEKVRIIHCGVDTKVFRPAEDPENGPVRQQDRPLCIVCVGTLHEVKGQRYLIDACQKLREWGIAVECHLVGDGPDRARLTDLVERFGLSDTVRFHGLCRRAQIADLLVQADVTAAPSVPTSDGRREGIPVALMEAMACGTVVVASRLSGIPELVENEQSGLLVPPGDAAALAAALRRLADDPQLRERLGEEGRKVIQQRFNLHHNAQRLAEMFSSPVPAPLTRGQSSQMGSLR